MQKTVHRLAVGTVALLLSLVIDAHISAAFAAAPAATTAGDISIAPEHPDDESPTSITLRARVGTNVQDAIVIVNHSDAPINVAISPVAGITGQTSGMLYTDTDDPLRQADRWVTPSLDALLLPANAERVLAFSVTVPAGASAGDHLAGVAVENIVPKTASNGIAMQQVFRSIIGVRVIVPGAATCVPSLKSLGIDQIGSTGVAAVDVGLANAGLQVGQPALAITLIGPDGYRNKVSRDLDTVLPGDAIKYPFAWPDRLGKGSYDITAAMSCGATSVTLHGTVQLGASFKGVAPGKAAAVLTAPKAGTAWWAWALIGFGVLAFILFMVIGYERRRTRTRRA